MRRDTHTHTPPPQSQAVYLHKLCRMTSCRAASLAQHTLSHSCWTAQGRAGQAHRAIRHRAALLCTCAQPSQPSSQPATTARHRPLAVPPGCSAACRGPAAASCWHGPRCLAPHRLRSCRRSEQQPLAGLPSWGGREPGPCSSSAAAAAAGQMGTAACGVTGGCLVSAAGGGQDCSGWCACGITVLPHM